MSVASSSLNDAAGGAARAVRAARRRGAFGGLALLVLALLLGLVAQVYLLRRQFPLDGAIFYVLAIFIFHRALRRLPDAVSLTLWQGAPASLRRAAPAAILAAVAFVLFWQRSNNLGIVVTVAAVLALVVAYWRAGLNAAGKLDVQRWEWAALGGIVLLALLLRVYRLSSFPGTLYLDEGDVGSLALQVVGAKNFSAFATEYTGHATMWFYALGAYLKLVGVSITSLRMFTIGTGLLSVVAIFFLGRELFGARGALLAAFFLAISTWHNTFSRVVFSGSAVPLFSALTFWLLLRGLRTNRPLDFVLAGLALGFGLNTYLAFRVVPIIVLLYLVYKLIGNRSFGRVYLPGLAMLVLAAVIVATPLGVYYLQRPAEFLSRTQAASVFLDIEREKSNAPLWANIRKAFGMFNYQGDPRPRHNLPNNPMLDPISGVFFALGFGYALLRWRRAEHSMLVTWLAVGMIPGVFSLADSNPHSLRTITNLPAVCLLAALGAERVDAFIAAHYGTAARQRLLAIAVAAGIAALLLNANTTFNLQAGNRSVYYDFDPVQNAVALEMVRLSGTREVYVAAAYTNHSAVKFLGYGRPYQTFNQSQHLPLRQAGDKDVVFFLEPVQRQLLSLFQSYYPEAQISNWLDRYGNLGYYRVNLSRDAAARALGVNAAYYVGGDVGPAPTLERREDALGGDWSTAPLEPPFTALWRGALHVPRYGPHTLILETTQPATVTLDGQVVLASAGGAQSANLTLFGGFHSLEVQAFVTARAGSLSLRWRTPDGQEQPVAAGSLFTLDVASNGLLGKYFRGNNWSGSPAMLQKDLFIFPNDLLPAPFSIEWEGEIYAPTDGQYLFGTASDDGSLLYIDDKLVVDNGGHHSERYVEGRVNLSEGLHKLRIRYFQDDGGRVMDLYWTPPNGRKDLVPSTVLFPPGTVISGPLAIVMPAPLPLPAAPATPPVAPAGPRTPAAPLPMAPGGSRVGDMSPLLVIGREGSGPGEFRTPRGLAVDREGNIYVADTGNKRVQKLDSAGKFLAEWKGGREPFVEPVAIVIAPNGDVFVLEPEKDGAHRFSASGQYLGKVGEGLGLYRPRGLTIDGNGTLFFANTGGNNIVRASATGQPMGTIGAAGTRDGQMQQPTDVAVDAQANVYVADTYNQRIQRFSPDGRPALAWAIAAAGTMLGPHLAVGPDGAIYSSDPDNHLINAYASDGAVLATWGGPGGAEGQLMNPVGLAFDGAGRLYIADAGNHRIQVWGKR